MKELILKLNHFIFKSYYSRIDQHFRQYTFFKSVDILRQNYQHDKILIRNAENNFRSALKELDSIRAELSNMRMQQIANPGTISQLNKMFGTDFTDSKDN